MASVNPYASPQSSEPLIVSAAGTQGVWRYARLLVVASGAELSDRCIKCNAPANGYRKKVTLSWHSPLAFLALLGGLLPYIIVAVILTRRVTVRVGVCQRHRRRRLLAILFGWLGCLTAIGLFVVGTLARSNAGAWAFIAGMLLLLFSLIGGLLGSRIVTPKRIRDRLAWVKGVDPVYLGEFPEFPGPW
jgi:hypothetical protein